VDSLHSRVVVELSEVELDDDDDDDELSEKLLLLLLCMLLLDSDMWVWLLLDSSS